MPTVVVRASASVLRLSDAAELTLTAGGPAPLRVELPAELLAPESAVGWQLVPAGPATRSADGAEWVQTFRLSPFAPGEALTVAFNPVRVNGTDVTPAPLTFKVETSLREASAADIRPVTGIEQLPAPPESDSSLIAAGVSLLGALVAVLVVVLVVARKRTAKPLTAGEWVREQLATLQSDRGHGRVGGAAFVTAVAEVFREYLTRRFGLNTEQKTTGELLEAGHTIWDADTRAEVEAMLSACDGVKFAGRVPGESECDDLTEQAGRLIARWEPVA